LRLRFDEDKLALNFKVFYAGVTEVEKAKGSKKVREDGV
jgi:hypothetical protein